MLAYRLILSILFPLLLLRLVARVLTRRERGVDLAQRLGAAPAPAGQGPVLWVHGASNGELASARGMVRAALDRAPGLRVLVTANTVTARAMVAGWNDPRIAAALAPLDHRLVLWRFLRRARPAVLVVVENEFWPNRLTACAARGLPVAAIGARMSARSARRWSRAPGLARQLLEAIRFLSPQDAASARHFADLGLPADRIGPALNLKADVTPQVPTIELARLAPLFAYHRTLLAASTHPGEEAMVLEAFARLHASDPAWRLILAPRHPRRGPELAALVARAGLGCATRSQGEAPGPAATVYLADTMGEMPLWYALAGITFVGGSLVDKGGHTPFEPAAQGSAILHGPFVSNAAEAYAALTAAGGAIEVTDAATLAGAVAMLADPAHQSAIAAAARSALTPTDEAAARAQVLAAVLALTGT